MTASVLKKIIVCMIVSCIAAAIVLFAIDYALINWQLICIALSLLLVAVPIISYTVKEKGRINILAPLCYPLLYFGATYVAPSIIMRHKYMDPMALNIQVIGITMYLFGAGASCLLFGGRLNKNQNMNVPAPASEIASDRLIYFLFLFIGIILLIVYGVSSKIPESMLSGVSVEDLRRTSEIGRGYIKEPGIFFVTFSGVWLLATRLATQNRMKTGDYMLLAAISAFIFLFTANKTPALLIIIIGIGLYNKYCAKLSVLKILILGLIIAALISVTSIVRVGQRVGLGAFSWDALRVNEAIYSVNYLPIVQLVHNGMLKLQHGREYIQNAMIVVPRFFWPDKPVNFDYFLKDVLYLKFEGGGVPATPFGSLYLNFGGIGVAFGMGMIGFVYKGLYRLYERSGGILLTVVALYLLPQVLNPSLFMATLILTLIYLLLILSVRAVLAVSHGRQKPTA